MSRYDVIQYRMKEKFIISHLSNFSLHYIRSHGIKHLNFEHKVGELSKINGRKSYLMMSWWFGCVKHRQPITEKKRDVI